MKLKLLIFLFYLFCTKSFYALTWRKGAIFDQGETVYFQLNSGTDYEKEIFKKYALEWTQFANLNFEFISNKETESNATENAINVIFGDCYKKSETSSSYFHTKRLTATLSLKVICIRTNQILDNIEGKNNFDISSEGFKFILNERRIRKSILHEVGHALGLVHEFQSLGKDVAINFDVLKETRNLSEESVNENYKPIDSSEIESIKYDKYSIMNYYFKEKEIRKDESDLLLRVDMYSLSLQDRIQIQKLYPGRSNEDFIRRSYQKEIESLSRNNNCQVLKFKEFHNKEEYH